MHMKKFVLIAAAIALTAHSSFADTNGGFGGAFARMGAGTRAKALGNAYTAIAEGPSALYFNPGALPFAPQMEFNASVSNMALDRSLDYLAFSTPLHPKAGPEKRVVRAGFGLGWLHARVGNIDSRDFDGNPLPTIDQSSNLFMFGFGIQFHERFGAGLTAKVVYETFGRIGTQDRSVNGNGFGVDFGAFARPIDHLTLGLQIKDAGSQTTWNTTDYWSQGSSKSDKWPLQYRLGAAYQQYGLTGAVDVESSNKSDTRIHAGVEAAHAISDHQNIAGRVGVDGTSPTFGVGFDFAVWKIRSAVDITYVLESIAPDNSTTIGWGVKF
jgi:hypothetical protein